MRKPELLASAGSMEAVRAAVCNGATAVYLGFGEFNARRGAKNFTAEEMREALAYCRRHGVKTNVTVNTIVSDREQDALLNDVRLLLEAGADALIVQDVGVARRIRERFPDAVLHASTQMTIHSLEGALAAKRLGFDRVVLSRELPLEEIRYITRNAGIETEIFVHGALCMCYSGQCGLSAVIGRRSGNRGLCAQPCRLPYGGNYPMSLKDLCLLPRLQALCEAGVYSLKIEGRMKRPEYVAIVTKIYSAVLHEERMPTREEMDTLAQVFSRDGFTQGYLDDKIGPKMFGIRTKSSEQDLKPLYAAAAKTYASGMEPVCTVPLTFTLQALADQPMKLTAQAQGHSVTVTGDGYVREGRCYQAVKPNNDTIVLFCHFALECVLLSHLLNVSPMILWHGMCAAPTSVTTVVTEERRKGIASFRILQFGDISHLYAGGEPPAFAARFCECFGNEGERVD